MHHDNHDNPNPDGARDSAPFIVADSVSEEEFSAALACPCRAPHACERCDAVMVRLIEGAAGMGAGRVAA